MIVGCDDDTAYVSVTDRGPGIPEEDLERIFESFVQVEGGPSRPYEGTGLGLTIAKMVVEVLDGEICVDSEVGRGSTFTIELPLIEAPPLTFEK
jgi:signal transduction histidine kinase